MTYHPAVTVVFESIVHKNYIKLFTDKNEKTRWKLG